VLGTLKPFLQSACLRARRCWTVPTSTQQLLLASCMKTFRTVQHGFWLKNSEKHPTPLPLPFFFTQYRGWAFRWSCGQSFGSRFCGVHVELCRIRGLFRCVSLLFFWVMRSFWIDVFTSLRSVISWYSRPRSPNQGLLRKHQRNKRGWLTCRWRERRRKRKKRKRNPQRKSQRKRSNSITKLLSHYWFGEWLYT